MIPLSYMGRLVRGGERLSYGHYAVDAPTWQALWHTSEVALPMLSFWADEQRAYGLFLEGDQPLLVSTAIDDKRYVGPSQRYPVAEWGERVAFDLYGVEAMEVPGDGRSALDGGAWDITWPLSQRPGPGGSHGGTATASKAPLWIDGNGVTGVFGLVPDMQQGGIRAEQCESGLGHRGVIAQILGRTPDEAMGLVSRMSAGGYVAYPLALARALMQAEGRRIEPAIRDGWMILLEIERVSVHLHDVMLTARGVDAGILAVHCTHAREALARVCAENGATRRLTDMIHKNGYRRGVEIVPLAQAVLREMKPRLSKLALLVDVYAPRLAGLAILPVEIARGLAIGGPVGRSSGRSLDLRRAENGMRLDALRATGSSAGDARARQAVRMTEIFDALRLIERILGSFGLGDADEAYPTIPNVTDQEGIGAAESARGDVWAWVRLRDGRVDAVHMRDPAVPLLAGLGRIMKDVEVATMPLALRSLGVSTAGVAQ
ncbi:NADH-quinone oxidoreductase subunit D-related protein [Neokomagataea anthophila]|uniref:NADH-quinone oxidoreductase subunit D domain-containing protein n=1 Tax=Neokomagataea anthophila TaxID=2826925 RepID=A0ABS5E599_9PROT|nr:hypothetical protein [Neokomagataea anthophila]MBR0559059.1 hypothetical protein [Neokomagataea anthophila]